MDDKMTWPPYVAALFGVGLLRPQEAGQETPPPAHPPFASYNHVLAKHS